MKVFVTLTLCALLASGANANSFTDFFKNLGSHIADAFNSAVDSVKPQANALGNQLLDTLKQTGSHLASQTLQSLAMTAMNALGGTGGTRALHLDFSKFHHDLQEIFNQGVHHIGDNLHNTIDHLIDVAHHATDLNQLASIPTQIDQIVQQHHHNADNLLHSLVQGATQHVQTALSTLDHQKRGLAETLASLGNSFAQAFKPHIDLIKQMVGGIGGLLKQSVAQLGQHLQTHISSIKDSGNQIVQHGANALAALKDATSDILMQTLKDIQPHVQNILNHGTAALNEVTNHTTNAQQQQN